MNIENENRYNSEEDEKINKKKKKLESGMVEFFVETTSITASTGGLNFGAENLAGNALGLGGGIEKLSHLDMNKFESIRKTAEYGRIYDEGIDKADDFIKKDKEITEKKIKDVRKKIKEISGKKR